MRFQPCSGIAFVVASLLAGAVVADAADFWHYTWDGSVTPPSNTPALTVNASGGSPSTTLNPDGTFTIETISRTDALSYRNSTEFTGWEDGRFSMIEFRVRVDQQQPQNSGGEALPVTQRYAQTIRIANDAPGGDAVHYSFFLRDGSVGFGRDLLGDESTNHAMNTTDGFHTYRILAYTDRAELYVDGNKTAVITATPTTQSIVTGPRIEFGDISTTYGAGTVTWDYIYWSNNLVPEPGSLLTCALVLPMLVRRSRRC